MTVENKEIGESQAEVKTEAKKSTEELAGSLFIDKRREEVEKAAIEAKVEPLKPTIEQLINTDEKTDVEEVKSEKSEEVKEVVDESDPVERVKSKVQKRIDKEVAKRKTIEEQLEDTRRELEEIRAKQNVTVVGNKDDAKSSEPTNEQIAAYLKKVREDGDTAEEVRVLDYIAERRAKAERKSAMDEIENQNKSKKEAQEKINRDIDNLIQDYTVKDDEGRIVYDDPMNLANVNGLLRKTADALFHDPKTKGDYSDPDRVMAYRRAVTDAFRTIYQLGLHKQENLTVSDTPIQKRRAVLVEPSSDGVEEVEKPSSSRVMSDQEKVIEEVRNRKKFQIDRIPKRQ